VVFAQICQIVSISNNPSVDIDELLIEVVKWAERHNYAALRLGQTTKRVIQTFCSNLSKIHFCKLKYEDNEITGITLVEPQFEAVHALYKQMEQSPETPFPGDSQLAIPLQPTRVLELMCDKINNQFIEENIEKNKMVKIIFPELNSHIFITPRLMVQLPTLCIKKIGKYYSATARVRLLDAMLKPLEVMMPEKNLKVERVLKVLNLEEKESPMFYIHLTENIISKLKKEMRVPENMPVLQAASILKQFKLEQDDKDKDEKKDELAREDFLKVLNFIKQNPKPHSLLELYHLREGEGASLRLAGSYDKNEFISFMDRFLEKFTQTKESNDPTEMVPEIILLVDDESRETFIYREFLVSLIERERIKAKGEIHNALLDKWTHALQNFQNLPEMKKDSLFEAEVAKFINRKFRLLKFVAANPNLLFSIFKVYENDKDIKSKKQYYFAPREKPTLLPFFAMMELTRVDLYREAYAGLTFVYRFFLSRLILFIMRLFRSTDKKSDKESSIDEKDSEKADSANQDKDDENQPDQSEIKKSVQIKVRKILPEIEKNYRAGGNIQEVLEELLNRWNIKVGEVRDILKEKVDKDTLERASSLYRMLLKSPNFSEESLHRELKNIAVDLVQNKYTDVHDKKALARYIVLSAIWILRSKGK